MAAAAQTRASGLAATRAVQPAAVVLLTTRVGMQAMVSRASRAMAPRVVATAVKVEEAAATTAVVLRTATVVGTATGTALVLLLVLGAVTSRRAMEGSRAMEVATSSSSMQEATEGRHSTMGPSSRLVGTAVVAGASRTALLLEAVVVVVVVAAAGSTSRPLSCMGHLRVVLG